MMTLDEAIKHCNEVACKHDKCATEHKQLAEWLTELKSYRASITQETQKTADKNEKIRKELMDFIYVTCFPVKDLKKKERFLDWLEKQGEHKPYGQRKECEDCQFNYAGECKGYCQMKKDEQKPTDNVEPKFHEGEWITNGNYTWKIVEIKPLDYILQSQDGNIVDDTISFVDEQFHSFTIKDAKDGDVLAAEDKNFTIPFVCIYKSLGDTVYKGLRDDLTFNSYCFIGFNGNFYEGENGHTTEGIHPATKEQRDTLMKAMTNAKYAFDFDKKELKKIESKKLDPDKVIAWLNDQACQGWIEDVEVDKFIAKFKKDFKL